MATKRMRVITEAEFGPRGFAETSVGNPVKSRYHHIGEEYACGNCGTIILIGTVEPNIAPPDIDGEFFVVRCFKCHRYNELPDLP